MNYRPSAVSRQVNQEPLKPRGGDKSLSNSSANSFISFSLFHRFSFQQSYSATEWTYAYEYLCIYLLRTKNEKFLVLLNIVGSKVSTALLLKTNLIHTRSYDIPSFLPKIIWVILLKQMTSASIIPSDKMFNRYVCLLSNNLFFIDFQLY